ncbi:MAG: hypothetical protein CBB71_01055 [Rhodopirellula sp. TMED11]|nr:MAG: hypothetical protein CBB71_01055 [Rhodopirellula sp. TMED11]
MRANLIYSIFLAVFSGCALLEEPPLEMPRGTPVSHGEIPEALRTKLDLPANASVERFGDTRDTASFRIEYPSGSVRYIGSNGEVHGGIL